MEARFNKGDVLDPVLDFSVDKVRKGNGVFDATKIKFSGEDTSGFN